MKKLFMVLATAALMLCTACGGSSVSVEGTWYSVTDATMYNFHDSEISVSGAVVGQYEDNGDSAVISMMATGENLQLYVTAVDDVDVLADAPEGECTVYFCKGLENAKQFMEDQEQALMDAAEAREAAIQEFAEYINQNLIGVWVSDGPGPLYDTVEFCADNTIVKTLTNGEIETADIRTDNGYMMAATDYPSRSDGTGYPEITIRATATGSRYGSDDIRLSPGDDPNAICLNIFGWPYTKK